MATDLRAFVEELNSVAQTVWPDCKPGGCWYAERINMEAFAGLELPLSVVQIGPLRRVATAGIANLTFEVVVAFWRVVTVDGDSSGFALWGSLNDLVNAVTPGEPFTMSKMRGIEEVSLDDDLPPNQVLRSANRSQRAGMVSVRLLTGAKRE